MTIGTVGLVAMYLGAVVLANVSFGIWGMVVEPWISMFLIGLDLTSRDRLHEAWGHRALVPKMTALILAGSAISALFGLVFEGVVLVAVASAVAFASTATVDALVFSVLPRRWLRINGSNAVGAVVDSFVFPTVAFGVVDWDLVVYFAAVKFIGGAIWWLVLGGWRDLAPRTSGAGAG